MSDEITRREALCGLVATAVSLVACDGTAANRGSDEDGGAREVGQGDSGVGDAADATDATDATGATGDAVNTDVSDELECEQATGAQTEGPFYPGEPAVRMDITEGLGGVPLTLDLRVVAQGGDCAPLADAEVDVWHADAAGDYSGYAQMGSAGETWMRGQQLTDAGGQVGFTTVIPGSYPGRAVHVHVKVRAPGRSELTTQVYFPDDVVAAVLGNDLYSAGAAQTINQRDGFYRADTLLEVTGDETTGYRARGVLVIG